MTSDTPRAGDTGAAGAAERPALARRAAATMRRQRGIEPAPASPAALVTGCSSGIGHAAALRLHAAGFHVYATARQPEALAGLAAAGITTARLDVTDDASMTAVASQITAGHGAVSVLVNNAGFELAGPFEQISLAQAGRQFDANFFGLARLTQLVIPGMREHGGGRIINLSSVFGRFAVPGNAYYAASKHAVAALTDSLRLELAGFGIRVILIEPTAARTSLHANTAWAASRQPDAYAGFRQDLADWHTRTYDSPPRNIAGRLAVSAGDVAAAITRAATTRRPRARYPVGALAHGLFTLRRWLPAPAFDAFVRTQFPAPQQATAPQR